MAETIQNAGVNEAKREFKEITLKFAKGLVGKEFQGKDGTDYKEIRIPNPDRNDKQPWQSFVVKANRVHEDQFGKGMWLKLPAEGSTTLQRSVVVGETPEGKKEWGTEKTIVTNAELKKLVEAYKERTRGSALEKQAAYEAAINEIMTDPKLSEVGKAEQFINLTEDYNRVRFTMEQKNEICDHAYQTKDMAETFTLVRTMSGQMRDEDREKSQNPEITLKFGKGLVGKEFQGKDGNSYKEIKIPNVDQNDKRPWQSFVVKANRVHEDQFGKGMWLKLPAEGSTTLQRSVVVGETPEGKKEWGTEKTTVTNAELKKLVEAYKERPRESITEKLAEKKAEAASQVVNTEPREKDRSRENALG